MARAKPPLFLARASYRRRRLRDAARLLPILGVVLLMLPLLWTPGAGVRMSSGDVVYFFTVWLALIAAAAGFAPGLRRGASDEGDTPGTEEED
jgi:hypothetical protein